jgi:hypothetical protein
MSVQGRKRKIDSECRGFKEQWNVDYFVIKSDIKALCLICNDTIAVLKEYNIQRHYETKHSSRYSQFTGQLRTEKFEKLQKNLSSMQFVFKKKVAENEAATRASFRVAHILAKKGKPFTDGELIKKCLNEAAQEMCPEKVDVFSAISLSANTVSRRVESLGRNIMSQLKDKAREFECFSVALDESTDVSDTSQLLLFVRGVNVNFQITEELASVHSMHGTTTGQEIFAEVEKSVAEYNLEWKQLKCITTDGGRNMCGTRTGLVGLINRAIENSGGLKPLAFHCIIHQQALCGKHVDLSSVLEPVVSTVNYIRSHGLNHRQFRDFLKEIDAEFPDLPYHTSVRWLSCGKVLARFFALRIEIELFLNEKNRPLVLLTDSEWLWKLAFSADLTTHLNDFNLRLQGETSLICDLYSKVKAFRQKLTLFETQLARSCLTHFSSCDKYSQVAATPFPSVFAQDIISALKQQFRERFSDLDACSSKIRIFENPFDCVIEDLPPELQMEVIDLQSNDILKDKFKEGNLIEFYKFLPSDQFLQLRKFAREFISAFGTTYICEKTFSKMKYTKSCYRSQLSDEHLNALLMIGTTHFEPQLDKILSEMHQYHVSRTNHD